MLIFGGAAWQPTQEWILPAVLFLVLRTMWKIGGARLASRWNGTLVDLGPNWGRAIVGQGGLAVALGLSYAYQEVLEQQNLVFSAAVLSVLLTDLLSARFARGLLPIDDLLPGPRVSGVGIVKREVAP
jgi:Kef-type K+ transport system membrane component KefB